MKTRIKNPFLLPALIAAFGLILTGRVTAQTFMNLHSFTSSRDGATPAAGLVLSGNALYGTAYSGGSSGNGTVFKVNTDGTGFTNLHNFTGGSGGAEPLLDVILSGNTLYGTTDGGSSGNGTVFAVNTDGTGFTNLHRFPGGSGGAVPIAGLILSGNTLYGTTEIGGSSDNGTVFAVNTDGTGFTNLHRFTRASDGAELHARLILSGNTLNGTASAGGSSDNGTVFAVNTDGTAFTNLHSFTRLSDGAIPHAGLILSGNTLYGTASSGGSSGDYGTVFAVNTDGTGFTNLHSFSASDRGNPHAGLILSGNTLYGAAQSGGSSGAGTVFAVNTHGTGFTNLHRFTGVSDGANPHGGLILSGNTLYGTARAGGSSGAGTVFSLSFAPQLTIIPSGANVILTWPTNVAGFDYTGFTLRSTTNLISPAVWSTVSPGPFVVNGQNSITNPVSGTQRFYRLSQ